MADKTAIEWTDASWNPLRGCTAVSAGCDNCYAAGVALRFSGAGLPYEGLAVKGEDGRPEWTRKIMLVPEHLHDPLRWERPRRIFVNSMSDLFHVGVPLGYIDQVFAVMALTPRHTYQILTKRPQRMANYLNDRLLGYRLSPIMQSLAREKPEGWHPFDDLRLPLPNVWVGTSVENQEVAHRIAPLLNFPAAVRFLSCEPLLGPLDLVPYLAETTHDAALRAHGRPAEDRRVGWVIVGGESGLRHRPIDPAWVRSLRDQCVATGVPFFFKQWGGRRPKEGGRTLDGLEWSQFPTAAGVPA